MIASKLISILLALTLVVSLSTGITQAYDQDYDWMGEGKWLLVHGKGGDASDWDEVKNVLQSYGVPSDNIYVPDLPNNVMLHEWTNNLVNWMDSQGMLSLPDGSVKVIAHSFGGAVTLYSLRATYELEYGNVYTLASDIRNDCNAFASGSPNKEACLEIAKGLETLGANPAIANKWIEAAKKIQGVYLYHPALRGGCAACTGGWVETWTAASICALGTVDIHLWHPISSLTWDGCNKIVNIYGFGSRWGCIGWCTFTGTGAHDKSLQDDHQRLLPGGDGDTGTSVSGTYTELFGGYHCHDLDERNAPEDLVNKIVENPIHYPYGIPLCGSVYDGNGGPLTDRCPYLVTCDVTVPEGAILTILPGAQIYFKSGRKITAYGTLHANGNLDDPIYLILFQAVPERNGINLNSGLRLQNGGELKLGIEGKNV